MFAPHTNISVGRFLDSVGAISIKVARTGRGTFPRKMEYLLGLVSCGCIWLITTVVYHQLHSSMCPLKFKITTLTLLLTMGTNITWGANLMNLALTPAALLVTHDHHSIGTPWTTQTAHAFEILL